MSYPIEEKIGIIDLLQTERQNVSILFQLAKSITKNVANIETEQEALECIFLHIPDSTTLLNKRIITKEVLFKYLHKNKVALSTDFTKTMLIKKVMDYWYQIYTSSGMQRTICDKSNSEEIIKRHKIHAADSTTQQQNTTTIIEEPAIFPIHLLARKFSEWFFDNYNKNSLKLNDFWSDAFLFLEIAANDGIEENICEDASTLLQALIETRQRFNFYFNPNLTHAGVQGRMDIHGLVLVLSCGTLHTEQNCVGVFECVFGLLRDPFAENNWKSKNIKLVLRSKGTPTMPSLENSDTLKEALDLPIPQGELT